MNRPPTTAADAWALNAYFDVGDELDGGLTLDDLDARFVAQARTAADTFGFVWPPDLATAEDYFLDHGRTVTALCDADMAATKRKARR